MIAGQGWAAGHDFRGACRWRYLRPGTAARWTDGGKTSRAQAEAAAGVVASRCGRADAGPSGLNIQDVGGLGDSGRRLQRGEAAAVVRAGGPSRAGACVSRGPALALPLVRCPQPGRSSII